MNDDMEFLLDLITKWFENRGIEIMVDEDAEVLYYYDSKFRYKILCKYNEYAMFKTVEKYKMDELDIIL